MADDEYVTIEADDEDYNSTGDVEDFGYAQIPDGDWYLGQGELPDGVTTLQAEIIDYNVGTNGWTEVDDIITSMSADYKNALAKIYNPEVYEFNLVAAPGASDPIVQKCYSRSL